MIHVSDIWILLLSMFLLGIIVELIATTAIDLFFVKRAIKRANNVTQEIVARNSVNKDVSHAEMQAMLKESE